MQTFGG